MPTQPSCCPLCGWRPHPQFGYRACIPCGLPLASWPRVAELVAIRDAAVTWVQNLLRHAKDDESLLATAEAEHKLETLARAELERSQPKEPTL